MVVCTGRFLKIAVAILGVLRGGGVGDGPRGAAGAHRRAAVAADLFRADVGPARMDRLFAVFRANAPAWRGYVPGAYDGAVTLLRAAESPASDGSVLTVWERVAAGGGPGDALQHATRAAVADSGRGARRGDPSHRDLTIRRQGSRTEPPAYSASRTRSRTTRGMGLDLTIFSHPLRAPATAPPRARRHAGSRRASPTGMYILDPRGACTNIPFRTGSTGP